MPRILLSILFFALTACQTIPPQQDMAARRIAVLKENGFQQVGDGWELGMSDRLLFGTNESRLLDPQKARLDALARALTGVGISSARVEGNTDSTGTPAYNLVLSGHRAQAVREVLVAGGMDGSLVQAIARGEKNPIGSNRTAAGRQENRRVVIIVAASDIQ